MHFIHEQDDTININNFKIPYDTFLELEPNYIKQENFLRREYHSGSHHHVFLMDGSQIQGEFPWEDGDKYIKRLGDFKVYMKELENEQENISKLINDTKNLKPLATDVNILEEKINALWKHIAEGMPASETIHPLQRKIRILNNESDS